MVRLALICMVFMSCSDVTKPEQYPVISSMTDVANFMQTFVYETDDNPNMPSIATVFNREMKGDCRTAAVMGKWALSQIGIDSRHIVLWNGTEWHHMITVSEDNTIMITNDEVVELPVNEWEIATLTWFNPPYQKLKGAN